MKRPLQKGKGGRVTSWHSSTSESPSGLGSKRLRLRLCGTGAKTNVSIWDQRPFLHIAPENITEGSGYLFWGVPCYESLRLTWLWRICGKLQKGNMESWCKGPEQPADVVHREQSGRDSERMSRDEDCLEMSSSFTHTPTLFDFIMKEPDLALDHSGKLH